MFTIYSIGDSAFLAQILNALAMICGTGDFKTLVAVGALLGLFVMGFQCLTSGTRQFNLHQVLIGMICYMCFFGPSVSVQIEDAYTDEVRVVDNVPLGAAAAGAMISNIGYGVTALFEQGYGTDDRMTERAFLEPLKILTGVRSATRDVSIIEAAGRSIGNADLAEDIDNYLRECTMVKVALGEVRPEAVYRGGVNALFYNSDVYGTHLSTLGDVTCAEATAYIRQSLDAFGQAEAAAALNRLLNIKEAGQTAQHLDKVDTALQMLDATGNNGTQYLQVAVLQPLYEKAVAGFYKDMGDTSSAVMVNQAIEQRNMQWAAEGSMFVSTMRPLMAFFEGFIYAITPLVGFLLVVGAFGMNLLTKYFQVVIWIQLWMPVMSVINLYVSMAARNEFSALVTTPMSFYTLSTGSQALQTWLGIGGMLTAATPMIALFLVTGSTYAFTALAGRMGGADHVNERISSPDILKPGGFLQQADHFKSDQISGTSAVGTSTLMYGLTASRASAINEVMQKTNSLSDSAAIQAARNFQNGMADEQTWAAARHVGEELMSTHQDLYNSMYNHLKTQGLVSGNNTAEDQAKVGQLALQVYTGADGKLGLDYKNGESRTVTQKTDPKSAKTATDWTADPTSQFMKGARVNLPTSSRTNDTVIQNAVPGISGAVGGSTITSLVPQENQLMETIANGKDFSRHFSQGGSLSLGVKATGAGTNTITTKSGETTNKTFGANITGGFAQSQSSALADAVRKGMQHTATETGKLTHAQSDQTGFNASLTDLRQSMRTYSQLKTAQENASGKEERSVSEWTYMIRHHAEARQMFEGVASQITGQLAVERNDMMKSLMENQGYNAQVAYDVANFQMIGKHEALGGETTKALIASTATGLSKVSVSDPSREGLEEPKSMHREDVERQTPTPFTYERANFNRIVTGAEHQLGQSDATLHEHNRVATDTVDMDKAKHGAELHTRGVEQAMGYLDAPPRDSAAQKIMGMFSNVFNSFESQKDQIRPLENAGLTNVQARALVHMKGFGIDTLKHADGSLTSIGQELRHEVQAMLGPNATQAQIDHAYQRIESHLNAAADANEAGKATAVVAFNHAIMGLQRMDQTGGLPQTAMAREPTQAPTVRHVSEADQKANTLLGEEAMESMKYRDGQNPLYKRSGWLDTAAGHQDA